MGPGWGWFSPSPEDSDLWEWLATSGEWWSAPEGRACSLSPWGFVRYEFDRPAFCTPFRGYNRPNQGARTRRARRLGAGAQTRVVSMPPRWPQLDLPRGRRGPPGPGACQI